MDVERTYSEKLSRVKPWTVHASINCSSDFKNLAARLTDSLKIRDYPSALDLLNKCVQARLDEQSRMNTRYNIPTDASHRNAIEIIVNLLSVIAEIGNENDNPPIIVNFQETYNPQQRIKNNEFIIFLIGRDTPVANVFSSGYYDHEKTWHPVPSPFPIGAKRRRKTLKRNNRKSRKNKTK